MVVMMETKEEQASEAQALLKASKSRAAAQQARVRQLEKTLAASARHTETQAKDLEARLTAAVDLAETKTAKLTAQLVASNARLAALEAVRADHGGLRTRLADTEAKLVAANRRHELDVENLETGGVERLVQTAEDVATLRKRKAEVVVAAQDEFRRSIKMIKAEKLEAKAEVNDQKDETQYMITHSQRQADAIDRLKALATTLGADPQHVSAAAALHGS